MKSRAIIPLAVGLLVGILAIKIFADVLRKARGAGSANNAIAVVYAGSDIASTAEIKASMLETRMIPRSLAPKLVFSDVNEVAGRVASLGISAGMPVVPSMLAPKGTLPGMGARIKDGYRAVSVKVDESSGVAGWLKPGCHVDVVAVMQVDGSSANKSTISKVILENMEVLAVGQDIGASGEVNASVTKSVTLAVPPQDVPRLHLATVQGTVRLAMRNQYDQSNAKAQTTDKELLGVAPAGGAKPQGGSGGVASSILGALFAKQPKISPHKTDKDHEASLAGRPSTAKVAKPVQSQPWRVEVLTGQQREEIWFDGSANSARRLDARADGRSRGLGAMLSEKAMPEMADTGVTDAVPEPGESSRSTESRE